jgi:hypothetical protein
MPTLTNKAREGRLAAINHLSNRRNPRNAQIHFATVRLALPLLAQTGKVIAPTHYVLH